MAKGEQRPNKLAKMGENIIRTQTFHLKHKTITTALLTNTTYKYEYQHQQRRSTKYNREHAQPCLTCLTIKSRHNSSAQVKISWISLLLIVTALQMCHSGAIANATVVQTSHPLSKGIINTHTDTASRRAMRAGQYSQPLPGDGEVNNEYNNSFRPIIPKDISPEYIAQNVFTNGGQYRVFEPTASDLRIQMIIGQKENSLDIVPSVEANNIRTEGATLAKDQTNGIQEAVGKAPVSLSGSKYGKPLEQTVQASEKVGAPTNIPTTATVMAHINKALPNSFTAEQLTLEERKIQIGHKENAKPQSTATTTDFAEVSKNIVGGDIKELEALLVEYADNFFNKAQYEPSSKLVNALRRNHTTIGGPYKERPTRHADANPHHHHHDHLHHQHSLPAVIRKSDGNVSVNIPRAMESGRLLFFSGLF